MCRLIYSVMILLTASFGGQSHATASHSSCLQAITVPLWTKEEVLDYFRYRLGPGLRGTSKAASAFEWSRRELNKPLKQESLLTAAARYGNFWELLDESGVVANEAELIAHWELYKWARFARDLVNVLKLPLSSHSFVGPRRSEVENLLRQYGIDSNVSVAYNTLVSRIFPNLKFTLEFLGLTHDLSYPKLKWNRELALEYLRHRISKAHIKAKGSLSVTRWARDLRAEASETSFWIWVGENGGFESLVSDLSQEELSKLRDTQWGALTYLDFAHFVVEELQAPFARATFQRDPDHQLGFWLRRHGIKMRPALAFRQGALLFGGIGNWLNVAGLSRNHRILPPLVWSNEILKKYTRFAILASRLGLDRRFVNLRHWAPFYYRRHATKRDFGIAVSRQGSLLKLLQDEGFLESDRKLLRKAWPPFLVIDALLALNAAQLPIKFSDRDHQYNDRATQILKNAGFESSWNEVRVVLRNYFGGIANAKIAAGLAPVTDFRQIKPKTMELWRKFKLAQDEEQRADLKNELATIYLDWTLSLAAHYKLKARQKRNGEDVVAFAFEGLSDAIERWDMREGVPFERYAKIRILGHIMDQIRRMGPLGRNQMAVVKALEESRLRFRAMEGREPSDEEILKDLSWTSEKLNEARSFAERLKTVSVSGAVDEEAPRLDLQDQPSEASSLRFQNPSESAALDDFWDFVSKSLSTREAKILELRFREGLTLEEIALALAKEGDSIKASRVSQILDEITSKLRERFKGREAEFAQLLN